MLIFLAAAAAVSLCAADAGGVARAADTVETKAADVDKLRFVKSTLLNGPSVQDRLDAAVVLVYSKEKAARQILLETLANKKNSPARQAVCNTILNSRHVIAEKEDFLKPLLAILAEPDSKDAKLAAQASLIFEYEKIEETITQMATSSENPNNVRLNALYALQLRPVEKQAVAAIASLISDPDKQIALAAKKALPYWIPAGMDRVEILRYLKHLSSAEISRKWIDFQQKEARRLENERNKWKELYLSSLSREYEEADDKEKGEILLRSLKSDLSPVRMWSLEKVSTLSPSVVLPPQFDKQLLSMISDSDRDVRLMTARMFYRMSKRNPAEKLLEQFKVEKYEDIKLELFNSLGEACNFAFLGSTIELSEEIRDSTFIIAERYLGGSDPEKAAVGAEVIRKMLEPNGLEPTLVKKYLKLISARFAIAQGSEPELAAQLLSVMASLCGQQTHRELTSRLYGGYFLEGLQNKDNEAVRRTSVIGLTNIDKTMALQKFKAHSMHNDPSENIRTIVMKLAGETGNSEDISWLTEKLANKIDSVNAWGAIKEILQRENSSDILKWTEKLEESGLSQERVLVLLVMAEKKAQLENNAKIIDEIRTKSMPLELKVHLKAAAFDKAAKIIAGRLKEGDLSVENPFAIVIAEFMTNSSLEQRAAFMKVLASVSETELKKRVVWQELLTKWKKSLGSPKPMTLPIPD